MGSERTQVVDERSATASLAPLSPNLLALRRSPALVLICLWIVAAFVRCDGSEVSTVDCDGKDQSEWSSTPSTVDVALPAAMPGSYYPSPTDSVRQR